MSPAQLVQLDLFLDENDWDIYYWATQEPPSSEAEEAALLQQQQQQSQEVGPAPGEWAQTVGAFKPAYRPVPARWRDSEVLEMLREHVRQNGLGKGGMAFMPNLDGRPR